MNKLIVSIGTLSSGGAERVLSILSDTFIQHYDQVIYLTWIDVPDFYTINPQVKRICVEKECNSKNLLKKILWFRNYIKAENPCAVLSFLAPFNILVCLSLMTVNVKIIVAERNDPRFVWNSFFQRYLRRFAYMFADGILEQTDNNRNYFTGSLLAKTSVIHNPVLMDDSYVGLALRTEKKHSIVSVARLKPQKNPEMQLKAFKNFLKSHPDYTMTMYGEGDYRGKIESAINDLGLQGKVLLPGAVSGVWNLIVEAKCFVMSSWYEGMPNALIEAMCLGLPCVSTKVSGAVDFIDSGYNGILVDLDNHLSMSKAMSRICDDNLLANRLGTNAVNLYTKLNQEVISKLWIDYIDDIISDNNGQTENQRRITSHRSIVV